jgi:hypothetical protein
MDDHDDRKTTLVVWKRTGLQPIVERGLAARKE